MTHHPDSVGQPHADSQMDGRAQRVYDDINQTIVASGLWDGEQRKTHAFLRTPDTYQISPQQLTVLESIGESLQACLLGLSHIASKVSDVSEKHNKPETALGKIFRSAIPRTYHDIMVLRPDAVPDICKIDIMEGADHSYHIAEIDGHNKHGLGYSELVQRIQRITNPGEKTFAGVAHAIAEKTRSRGENKLVLLHASQEKFYIPEFRILKQSLAENGIDMLLVAEHEAMDNKELRESSLCFDFPFFHRTPEVNQYVVQRYKEGSLDFILPPKPYLSSKLMLGLLRNDHEDQWLESILRAHIRGSYLENLRGFIPKTFLVEPRMKNTKLEKRLQEKSLVLKPALSSGTKGVLFPDDVGYEIAYKKAFESKNQFVLQEQITNKPQRFRHFKEDGSMVTDDLFIRLNVYYAHGSIAGAKVAARKEKLVHGSRDALQLGVTLPK